MRETQQQTPEPFDAKEMRAEFDAAYYGMFTEAMNALKGIIDSKDPNLARQAPKEYLKIVAHASDKDLESFARETVMHQQHKVLDDSRPLTHGVGEEGIYTVQPVSEKMDKQLLLKALEEYGNWRSLALQLLGEELPKEDLN